MLKNSELKNDNSINARSVRFAIATFGCKTNQSESDKMIMELLSYGFNLVEYNENPDFMVINTCTVTSISDKKARQFIRKIKLLNPTAKIIVTGCFVGLNNEFLKENEILYIFPNNKKDEITDFIKKESGFKDLPVKNEKNQEFTGKHARQFIKIQDGCEQKCSYCIVPYVRNKYTSESPSSVISDIKNACSNGIEEIVITGIHIGKYAIDFKGNSNNAIDDILFSELDLNILCRLLITKTGIKRIRLSSIEVNEITDELLNLISTSNAVAEHLHIPLQSGSSRILEKMGRPYDMNYFFEKINKIKKMIPGIALTTDVIVGFPGENELDFDETLEAVKKVSFSRVHVFKYSPRKLTPAAAMDNQVAEEIKNERSLGLRKIALELRERFISLNIDKTLQTAVERIDYFKNYASGMSGNYIKVYFPSNRENEIVKIGRIVNVKTNLIYLDGLKGEIV
jgi:threonylcarbamoyladenosine tRNA methylthiotransferase MtaB